MNRLLSALILGVIAVAIGNVLLSYSSYYSNIPYSSTDCYSMYPPSYSNMTHIYNYSRAYYTCEANSTAATEKAQLYSSLLNIPGAILVFGGGIAFIASIVLILLAAYKDRRPERQRK